MLKRIAVLVVCAGASCGALGQHAFYGILGQSGGQTISDSHVVVLNSGSNLNPPTAQWTTQGGIINTIGIFDGVMAGSSDGSVLAGMDINNRAYSWTLAQGPRPMPNPDGGVTNTEVTGISANGQRASIYDSLSSRSYVYDRSTNTAQWVPVTGATSPIITPDGTTVAGAGVFASGASPYLWDSSGVHQLPRWSNAPTNPVKFSGDGHFMLAYGQVAGRNHSLRWSAQSGYEALGAMPGGSGADVPSAANQDGSVIVGSSSTPNGIRAYIWDPSHGTRNLTTVLTQDYGLSLSGWTLFDAQAISSDGTMIVGIGQYDDANGGHTGAWVAVIPAPAPLTLVGAALIALARRRHRGPARS